MKILKYKQFESTIDIDPYGEENWNDMEDPIGKSFYEVVYKGSNSPDIGKIYCREMLHGYYLFTLDNNRVKTKSILYPEHINIVKNENEIVERRNSFLISGDNKDLFVKVADSVINRYKEAKINSFNREIEKFERMIKGIKDMNANEYIKMYKRNNEFGE